jgi:hypothetical protein
MLWQRNISFCRVAIKGFQDLLLVEMTRECALGANLCENLRGLDSGFRVKGTMSRVKALDPPIVDLHCDRLRKERWWSTVRPRLMLPEVVTDGIGVFRAHVSTLQPYCKRIDEA